METIKIGSLPHALWGRDGEASPARFDGLVLAEVGREEALAAYEAGRPVLVRAFRLLDRPAMGANPVMEGYLFLAEGQAWSDRTWDVRFSAATERLFGGSGGTYEFFA